VLSSRASARGELGIFKPPLTTGTVVDESGKRFRDEEQANATHEVFQQVANRRSASKEDHAQSPRARWREARLGCSKDLLGV
jgi:hypothetical protein